MKKKLSLSKLSKDAICKEEQREINGGTAIAACWTDWEASGKTGGYEHEQALNGAHDTAAISRALDFLTACFLNM